MPSPLDSDSSFAPVVPERFSPAEGSPFVFSEDACSKGVESLPSDGKAGALEDSCGSDCSCGAGCASFRLQSGAMKLRSGLLSSQFGEKFGTGLAKLP